MQLHPFWSASACPAEVKHKRRSNVFQYDLRGRCPGGQFLLLLAIYAAFSFFLLFYSIILSMLSLCLLFLLAHINNKHQSCQSYQNDTADCEDCGTHSTSAREGGTLLVGDCCLIIIAVPGYLIICHCCRVCRCKRLCIFASCYYSTLIFKRTVCIVRCNTQYNFNLIRFQAVAIRCLCLFCIISTSIKSCYCRSSLGCIL